MKAKKRMIVPIKKIKNLFDVRADIDDARVTQLRELLEAGVTLDPIEITSDSSLASDEYAITDGRHRAQAHEDFGHTEVECVWEDTSHLTNAQRMALSYSKNKPSGCMIPKKADYMHGMRVLLESGEKPATVTKTFVEFLPLGIVKRFLQTAVSEFGERRVNAAKRDMVAENLTPEAAAVRHKISVESLKASLLDRIDEPKGPHIDATLQNFYRSFYDSTRNVLDQVRREWELEIITTAQFLKASVSLDKLARRFLHRAADFKARSLQLVNARATVSTARAARSKQTPQQSASAKKNASKGEQARGTR